MFRGSCIRPETEFAIILPAQGTSNNIQFPSDLPPLGPQRETILPPEGLFEPIQDEQPWGHQMTSPH